MYIALLVPLAFLAGRKIVVASCLVRATIVVGIMKGKLPQSKWPEELKHPEVKGVFVGGCVSRGVGSRFRAKAHAHTSGEHCGWICFLSEKRLTCRMLCLHELAHIVTKEGHTKRWRDFLLQIGGTLDPVGDILRDYHPRPKQPKGTPEGGASQ